MLQNTWQEHATGRSTGNMWQYYDWVWKGQTHKKRWGKVCHFVTNKRCKNNFPRHACARNVTSLQLISPRGLEMWFTVFWHLSIRTSFDLVDKLCYNISEGWNNNSNNNNNTGCHWPCQGFTSCPFFEPLFVGDLQFWRLIDLVIMPS